MLNRRLFSLGNTVMLKSTVSGQAVLILSSSLVFFCFLSPLLVTMYVNFERVFFFLSNYVFINGGPCVKYF